MGYSGDDLHGLLKELQFYFYAELVMSSIGLLVILISMYKIPLVQLKGYIGLFWASAFIGYVFMLAYGQEGINVHADHRIAWRQYFQAIGVFALEFCFSIVNLALSNLSRLLVFRSKKVQMAWLAFSFAQVFIGLFITTAHRMWGNPRNTIFWSHTWLFWAQLLNLIVFASHMIYIQKEAKKMVLSQKTVNLLNAVLERFVEYCVCYMIFLLSTGTLMVLAFVDICGSWSPACDTMLVIAFYLLPASRFYAFLRIIYIFQPYWIRRMVHYRIFQPAVTTNLVPSDSMLFGTHTGGGSENFFSHGHSTATRRYSTPLGAQINSRSVVWPISEESSNECSVVVESPALPVQAKINSPGSPKALAYC